MKYSVVYTRTFSVDIESDSEEEAVELWEDMDLDKLEAGAGTPNPVLCSVEWTEPGGGWNIREY
jgi:hypothetical protein